MAILRPATRAALGLCAVVSLVVLPAGSAQVAAAYSEVHPVLAYYYNWWGPGTFLGTIEQPIVDYGATDHVREHAGCKGQAHRE
jgi:hypothetical protein